MESANKLMEQYSTARRQSISSIHSESKRNILLFQNVGRTLQRTHSNLKKTRLLHAFYLLALPVYTVIGAFIFQVKKLKIFMDLLSNYNPKKTNIKTIIII